ncbi:MAG: hypothetical protein OXM55_01425 [Bdellovibrionales bacterium]|nr:hypothetical protein [Bdellovibrionales bacterium]
MNKSTISPADEIWALIKETQRNLKKMSMETDRQRAEADRQRTEEKKQQAQRWAEAEKRWAEAEKRSAKIDRQIQKIGGRFNRRWGALVESLVEGKLVKIFQDQGIDITQTHTRSQSEWRKPDGRIERREFDIIVANGTEVVVVEVKTTLVPKDVSVFLETIRDFRNYFRRYKTETIYGAMAYLASENKAHSLAEEEGLFLIRATGDSASLVNKEGFRPKAFN